MNTGEEPAHGDSTHRPDTLELNVNHARKTRSRKPYTSDPGSPLVLRHDKPVEMFDHFRRELEDYSKLTGKLISEIYDPDNGLSHRARAVLEATVLKAHWNYWEDLRHACGFARVHETAGRTGGRILVSHAISPAQEHPWLLLILVV